MEAPSASDLLSHPLVQQALQKAWADSLPQDADRRHEEGGWIYMDTATGEFTIRRAPAGATAAIDLTSPAHVSGSVVVSKFHTHPGPTADGWDPGPSAGDVTIDARHGVPDLIQADTGTYISGPNRRRGGVVGLPGYPA